MGYGGQKTEACANAPGTYKRTKLAHGGQLAPRSDLQGLTLSPVALRDLGN